MDQTQNELNPYLTCVFTGKSFTLKVLELGAVQIFSLPYDSFSHNNTVEILIAIFNSSVISVNSPQVINSALQKV